MDSWLMLANAYSLNLQWLLFVGTTNRNTNPFFPFVLDS
jgi:hypothetical protein